MIARRVADGRQRWRSLIDDRWRFSRICHWLPLPIEGERVGELVVFGDGKDADVYLELADGRWFEFGESGGVTVELEGGGEVVVESVSYDDRSRMLRFTGAHLVLETAQLTCQLEDEEDCAEMKEAVDRYFTADSDQRETLWFDAGAEFRLSAAGDQG